MNINDVQHILRNPYGYSDKEIREARLAACDEIDKWKDAYENLREWCDQNGLDTVARQPNNQKISLD